jgi:hypothetical protein
MLMAKAIPHRHIDTAKRFRHKSLNQMHIVMPCHDRGDWGGSVARFSSGMDRLGQAK